MKNAGVYFLSLSLMIFLNSCDPTFTVSYNVKNDTQEDLLMIVSYMQNTKDTISISPNSTESVYADFGIGISTEDVMENIEALPGIIDNIEIFNEIDSSFLRDEMNFNNWEEITPSRNHPDGQYLLTVNERDF